MQLENRKLRNNRPISRGAFALFMMAIMVVSIFLATQVLFSLLKQLTKGRRRRKK